MKYNVLHNFISPITGKLPITTDYVLVGDSKGFSIASPILIDIKSNIDDIVASDFIIGHPSAILPKAQVLSALDDGYIFNTAGVISTNNDVLLANLTENMIWIGNASNKPIQTLTINIDNLPNLTKDKIWKGDNNNRPIEVDFSINDLPDLLENMIWKGDGSNRPIPVETIGIDNLPELGSTNYPIPTGGFIGEVWEGTASGRPEKSSIVGEIFTDVGFLNIKFLSGHFVMNKGLAISFPSAQFLDSLTAGALIKTSVVGDGQLESVLVEENYILMGGLNNGISSRAKIFIDNLPNLSENKFWKGNAENKPIEANFTISDLPNLTDGKIWKGNVENRPIEVEYNDPAPINATYVINTPSAELTNAQIIEELGVGMSKMVVGGKFALAIPDEDYATVATLEEIKDETKVFRDQAEASATAAEASADAAAISASAAEASAAEASLAAIAASASELAASASAAEATVSASAAAASAIASAVSASAAAASAVSAASSASNAQNSVIAAESFANKAESFANKAENFADAAASSAAISANSATLALAYLNQLLNTGISLTGDVTGSGPLKDPISLNIADTTIIPGTYNNPTIIFGSDGRATSAIDGPSPSENAINIQKAVDIVYGTISNIKGNFSGFASSNQKAFTKFKSSYCLDKTKPETSSYSVDMLDRYNKGYSLTSENYSEKPSNFIFQKNNGDIKTDLYKYDAVQEKFIFYKPVILPGLHTIDDTVNLVYGTLNNISGSFSGFACKEKHNEIKIKTSYQISLSVSSSSSLALLNRHNKGYNIQTETIGLNAPNLNLQHSTGNLQINLLDYNGLNEEFNYYKNINFNDNVLRSYRTPTENYELINKEFADSRYVQNVSGTIGQIESTGGFNPIISLPATGVVAGQYSNPIQQVDEFGRITSIANGQTFDTGDVTFKDCGISFKQNASTVLYQGNGGILYVDRYNKLIYSNANGAHIIGG